MRRLLQDWVSAQAEKAPERAAVVSEAERLSYERLETESNQLARFLRENGSRKGDRICTLTPKSPAAIVSQLGIYKADGIYVPLDPSSPAWRLKRILKACAPRWILAGGAAGPLGELLMGEEKGRAIRVGWMEFVVPETAQFSVDFSARDLQGLPSRPLEYRAGPQDPAHVLFASGSTGVPEGAIITHADVIHLLDWANNNLGLDATDRVSCHSPLHSGLSTFDLFGAFAAGARVYLVPPHLNLLPNKLADFIRWTRLTQWFSVPSILTSMANRDVLSQDDCPALKRVLWYGDVLPTPSLIYWMTRLRHVSFTSLDGPMKTIIAGSYPRVRECPEDPTAALPMGPRDAEESLVLDERLRKVPA